MRWSHLNHTQNHPVTQKPRNRTPQISLSGYCNESRITGARCWHGPRKKRWHYVCGPRGCVCWSLVLVCRPMFHICWLVLLCGPHSVNLHPPLVYVCGPLVHVWGSSVHGYGASVHVRRPPWASRSCPPVTAPPLPHHRAVILFSLLNLRCLHGKHGKQRITRIRGGQAWNRTYVLNIHLT